MSRVLRSDLSALLSIAAGGLLCGQFVAPTAIHILGTVDPAAEVLEIPSEASALQPPVRLWAPVQSKEVPAFLIAREGHPKAGLTSWDLGAMRLTLKGAEGYHARPVTIAVTNTRLRWLSPTFAKPEKSPVLSHFVR